ncbi:hypothetical protein [Corynebacterium sp. TAE3-ERU30]|uniref:hypothetical protein n=1 Tax=Corynebacterium sp. TAE3-ERU30 TaxID=2849496 RepID=UPI001C436DE8|nr:hypothetical protein [Corynebacterium sp. TAE3-ERU30]
MSSRLDLVVFGTCLARFFGPAFLLVGCFSAILINCVIVTLHLTRPLQVSIL